MKRQTFFVRYPPEGDATFRAPRVETAYDGLRPAEWKPCTYGIEPEYANAHRTIDSCHALWESTGNRLYVVEAFRAAAAAKLYPPIWVLEELNARFTDALTRDITLDRAFGFSGEGLGSGRRVDARTQDWLLRRNYLLSMAILKLEAAGLRRGQACDALARILPKGLVLGDRTAYAAGYALPPMQITGKGIRKAVDDYAATSADSYASLRKIIANASRTWTAAERREFLRPLFPDGIPIVIADEN